MKWARVAVQVGLLSQEAVSGAFQALGSPGTEETSSGEIVGYFPVDDTLEEKLRYLRNFLDHLSDWGLEEKPPEYRVTFVQEEDWASAWKQFFHPMEIGRRLLVTPPWEVGAEGGVSPKRTSRLILQIDPGMAFGTGAHPTTQLCLQLLEKYLQPNQEVLDYGTGSGILAIAAVLLGAGEVVAVDNDPMAIRVARQNFLLNPGGDQILLLQAETPAVLKKSFNLVLANLLAGIITSLRSAFREVLCPGGLLISSGILVEQSQWVKQSLAEVGLETLEVCTQKEWSALVSCRKAE